MLSLGCDAWLRVSELTVVEAVHIDPQQDGSATLFIPFSKTDPEGEGAWAWLSAETMRRVGAWLEASGIAEGPLFRRVGVDRRPVRSPDSQRALGRKQVARGRRGLVRVNLGGG